MAEIPVARFTIQALPPELLDLITDELSSCIADLKSLSLAARTLLPFARRHVFKTLLIRLTPERMAHDALEFLLHAPHSIRDAVRELTLCRTLYGKQVFQSLSHAQLASLITHLPRLQCLRLIRISLKPDDATQTSSTAAIGKTSGADAMGTPPPRHLRRLEFRSVNSTEEVATSFLSMLARLVTLDTLCIAEWELEEISKRALSPIALRPRCLELVSYVSAWVALLQRLGIACAREGVDDGQILRRVDFACDAVHETEAVGRLLASAGRPIRELVLNLATLGRSSHSVTEDTPATIAQNLALRDNCPALQALSVHFPFRKLAIAAAIFGYDDGGDDVDMDAVIFDTVVHVVKLAALPLETLICRIPCEAQTYPITVDLDVLARHWSCAVALIQDGMVQHLRFVFAVSEDVFGPLDGVVVQSLRFWVDSNVQQNTTMAALVERGKVSMEWVESVSPPE